MPLHNGICHFVLVKCSNYVSIMYHAEGTALVQKSGFYIIMNDLQQLFALNTAVCSTRILTAIITFVRNKINESSRSIKVTDKCHNITEQTKLPMCISHCCIAYQYCNISEVQTNIKLKKITHFSQPTSTQHLSAKRFV